MAGSQAAPVSSRQLPREIVRRPPWRAVARSCPILHDPARIAGIVIPAAGGAAYTDRGHPGLSARRGDAVLGAKLGELKGCIERFTGRDGGHPTAIAPLSLFRASAPSEPVQAVYEPALVIVAQGCKRVSLADEIYHFDPAHFLLVSVGLPVAGQVINASPESPYLSLRIDLDPGQLSELILAAGPAEAHGRPQRGPGGRPG